MMPETEGTEAVAASVPLARVVYALVRLCGYLSALLILVILAVVIYAITHRYVLNAPILGGDELLGYLLVAAIMLGAAEALRRGDHISIDLLADRASPSGGRMFRLWSDLAVFVFSIVLGWSAWRSISFAYDFGSYSPGYLEVAMWIPKLPILIGSVLLAATALARMLDAIAGAGRT
jgi:TRAP-type C4-dicarboxylate transport system permease small subunit